MYYSMKVHHPNLLNVYSTPNKITVVLYLKYKEQIQYELIQQMVYWLHYVRIGTTFYKRF